MSIDRERYLTIKEAAKRSGYDYEYLRKRVKAGRIVSLEIDERVRLVDWQDLQRYIKEEAKPHQKPHPKKTRRPTD